MANSGIGCSHLSHISLRMQCNLYHETRFQSKLGLTWENGSILEYQIVIEVYDMDKGEGTPREEGLKIRKQIGFQDNLFKENSKDTEVLCKEKIRKHGKKKNDKDEIGNILLKHAFTSL